MAKKKAAKKKTATKKSATTKSTKKKTAANAASKKRSTKTKTAKKKSPAKKKSSASKRELIAPHGDKRYVRRDDQGRFDEVDDVGRSLSADRRKKAKHAAKPGEGDKGDRRS
jgi:hypothetical protein